jgi:hypothetical protein
VKIKLFMTKIEKISLWTLQLSLFQRLCKNKRKTLMNYILRLSTEKESFVMSVESSTQSAER